MTTKLSNGEEMMLVEVPEDAFNFSIFGRTFRFELPPDEERAYTAQDTLHPFPIGVPIKILGTLESGIFKGNRMLSDEQRAALKTADPDKKYVVLIKK